MMTRNSSLYAAIKPIEMQSTHFQAPSTSWSNEAILALIAILMMLLIPLASWIFNRWMGGRHGIYT